MGDLPQWFKGQSLVLCLYQKEEKMGNGATFALEAKKKVALKNTSFLYYIYHNSMFLT